MVGYSVLDATKVTFKTEYMAATLIVSEEHALITKISKSFQT